MLYGSITGKVSATNLHEKLIRSSFIHDEHVIMLHDKQQDLQMPGMPKPFFLKTPKLNSYHL